MKIGILFGEFKNWDEGFSKERTKKAYEFFSRKAKEQEVELLFSTFDRFSSGQLTQSWKYDNGWKIVGNYKIDMIFDRAPSNKKNQLIKEEIAKEHRLINSLGLNKLGWDKLYTYDYFSESVPRCFEIKTYEDLISTVEQIGSKKIVIKPRYGIGGCNIEFLDKDNLKKYKDKKFKETIVQEFIDSSKGIKELGIKGVHDLRVIIVDGEIDHCYVRIAKGDCLMANCCKGGIKKFIETIPPAILKIVREVDSRLEKYKPRIYSIDFVYDENQQPWIMELETIPGISYYDKALATREKFMENMIKAMKNAPAYEPIVKKEVEEVKKEEE